MQTQSEKTSLETIISEIRITIKIQVSLLSE